MIEVKTIDILKSGADIIVMSANPSLQSGSGLSGLIHKEAGPELESFSKTQGPVTPGCSVVTPAFNIEAKYIIHSVCPRYFEGSKGECELLAKAYRSALAISEQCLDTESIAFPSLGTGIYRWPLKIAADIAVRALQTSSFKKTLICVIDEQARAAYTDAVANL